MLQGLLKFGRRATVTHPGRHSKPHRITSDLPRFQVTIVRAKDVPPGEKPVQFRPANNPDHAMRIVRYWANKRLGRVPEAFMELTARPVPPQR